MNFKSILTRTLPLIIVLLLVIGIAVSCTLISTERDVPSVSNKDGIYATYKHEGTDIKITNDEMYQLVKNNGLSLALNWVDKQILSAETNAEGKTYFSVALADEAALKLAKREAIYGDSEAEAELTDEEKAEKLEAYVESMVNSGYKGISETDVEALTAEEKDIFALQNAKEAYAWDQLAEDIKEQDELAKNDEEEDPYFTDSEIESYYSSNYENSYWAIVIPYSSTTAVTRALEQLGIEIVKDGSTTKGWGWISKDDEAADKLLTASQILDAFIKLYNNANAYKNNGSELITSANVSYDAIQTEGKFDAAKAEALGLDEYFYYTYDELNSVNSSVRSRINGTALTDFFTAASDKTGTDVKGYTKSAYTASSTYYLLLKLDVVEVEVENPLWTDDEETVMDETLKAEIIAQLTEDAKTDKVVNEKIVELRKEYGLMFYDTQLETSYINSVDSKFEASKKENKENVLKLVVDGKDVFYSTDAYFEELSKRMASSFVLDFIMKEIVLLSDYNEVIEGYTPEMTYKQLKKAVVDDEKWNELLESIQALKNNFAGNAFSAYGFPSSYGWTNFLRDFYLQYYGALVTSDEDLMVYYIYQEALANMSKDANTYLEDTALQAEFATLMQERAEEYFNVGGYHLLISVYEADGKTMVSPLEQDAWTAAQVAGAKELHDEIANKILVATNPETVLQDFVTAFNAAPYYSLYGTDGSTLVTPDLSNQPSLNDKGTAPYLYSGLAGELTLGVGEEINLSKYKSLGLSVKYESLTAFGPGKMVEEFETYSKQVWDSLRANGELTYNDEDKKWEISSPVLATANNYLATEFGYHVFTVTSAQGFSGTVPTENAEANAELGTPAETKKAFIEYFVPSTALLVKYVEIIESDEYKELLESEDYEAGDEDEYLEEKGFTAHQVGSIENYYNVIATELTGNYVSSLKLINQLNIANLTANNTIFDTASFAFVLESQKEYCVESMTYLGEYFATLYGIDYEAE